jgi:hypothetical protein
MSIEPTSVSAGASGALPVINQALEPASVRDGSRSTQKAYATALAFEQTLVEQLSQSLVSTSGLDGGSSASGSGSTEGESGSEEGAGLDGAADSQLSSMLPQALTSSVMHAGGLGLAAQITHQLEAQDAGANASTSANTTAAGGTGAS